MSTDENIAIKVDNVAKVFKLPHEKQTSVKSALINMFRRGKNTYERQQVLNDISFSVKKGEFFGIVGRNGSGKSTLLKLLGGIYTPTSGSIDVRGKLTPFIELGVGFNPELTGRENVFLNGALLGFNREEMEGMYDDIVSFAELEKFMDQKLKNYSSGMQVRLAFSIAIRAKSDILLIDEVLAVGDSAFQRKCYEIFMQLKRDGRTIVFVTHDMSAVERFCDKALVIKNGKMIGIYDPSEATGIYDELNASDNKNVDLDVTPETTRRSRWGSGKIKLQNLYFTSNGLKVKNATVAMGKKMGIHMELKNDSQSPCVIGLAFEDAFGVNIAGPNSIGREIRGNQVTYVVDTLPLLPGEYKLTIVIFDPEMVEEYDHLEKKYTFTVTAEQHNLYGKINMFGAWE